MRSLRSLRKHRARCSRFPAGGTSGVLSAVAPGYEPQEMLLSLSLDAFFRRLPRRLSGASAGLTAEGGSPRKGLCPVTSTGVTYDISDVNVGIS